MIMQIVNIVGGSDLVALDVLKNSSNPEHTLLHTKLVSYKSFIGILVLALGVIALVDRIGFLPFFIPSFGASYPQAIPAILTGLLLGEEKLAHSAPLKSLIDILKPYERIIGILGVLAGLGSILFGCILCTYI